MKRCVGSAVCHCCGVDIRTRLRTVQHLRHRPELEEGVLAELDARDRLHRRAQPMGFAVATGVHLADSRAASLLMLCSASQVLPPTGAHRLCYASRMSDDVSETI